MLETVIHKTMCSYTVHLTDPVEGLFVIISFVFLSFPRAFGSALAQCVIVPAPRQTTISPELRKGLISSARSSGCLRIITFRCPLARNPSTKESLFTPGIGVSPAA